jgi:hypothetical protein
MIKAYYVSLQLIPKEDFYGQQIFIDIQSLGIQRSIKMCMSM